MKAFTPDWFTHHRERMATWHHDDLDGALADITQMKAEIEELQQETAGHPATDTVGQEDSTEAAATPADSAPAPAAAKKTRRAAQTPATVTGPAA